MLKKSTDVVGANRYFWAIPILPSYSRLQGSVQNKRIEHQWTYKIIAQQFFTNMVNAIFLFVCWLLSIALLLCFLFCLVNRLNAPFIFLPFSLPFFQIAQFSLLAVFVSAVFIDSRYSTDQIDFYLKKIQ